MDFDKAEIARHLCVMEFESFSKIVPTECLNQAWNKKNKDTKAANITSIIRRFNEVCKSLLFITSFCSYLSIRWVAGYRL